MCNSEQKFNDDFSKDKFKEFMRSQKDEIEKYKWIESEKAGRDLGIEAIKEWIEKYAEAYRKTYFSHKD